MQFCLPEVSSVPLEMASKTALASMPSAKLGVCGKIRTKLLVKEWSQVVSLMYCDILSCPLMYTTLIWSILNRPLNYTHNNKIREEKYKNNCLYLSYPWVIRNGRSQCTTREYAITFFSKHILNLKQNLLPKEEYIFVSAKCPLLV